MAKSARFVQAHPADHCLHANFLHVWQGREPLAVNLHTVEVSKRHMLGPDVNSGDVALGWHTLELTPIEGSSLAHASSEVVQNQSFMREGAGVRQLSCITGASCAKELALNDCLKLHAPLWPSRGEFT